MSARPRLPPRDARGRFIKRRPPPLDPALVRRLGVDVIDVVPHEPNVLEVPREHVIDWGEM
jgi:hypothetical protein